MISLLLAALLVQEAPAKDDAFETKVYNVEFLTRPIKDLPGFTLSLGGDMIDPGDGDYVAPALDGEALVQLIRNNIAEDSWEHASATATYGEGGLAITNRRSVQLRVAAYLDYWRGLLGKMIVVDALVVSVDPEFLATLRAAGPGDRPGVLTDDQVSKLLAAAREGKQATLVKAMRTSAHPGQRVHMADAATQSYVRDYDVQAAVGVTALDPNPSTLTHGIVVDVRPRLEPFGNAVSMDVRIDRLELKALADRVLKQPREVFPAWPVVQSDPKHPAPPQAFPMGGGRIEEARIQLPRAAVDTFRTTLTVRSGETAVAAATLRGGRVVAYLLRPAIVALEDKPAAEPVFDEQRLVRLYDISPLTRLLKDFPGPRIWQPGGAHDGRALAGASFALEEAQGTRVDSENLVEMIKTRIAADTWANRRNRIEGAAGGMLLVRQRPEVLAEIDKFLADLVSARAQVITTEAVVVGFRKGARAEWERKIPALGLGGYFIPKDQYDELLKEAFKGGNVRVIESGEITSYPQQRVHAGRIEEEAYLADQEPQVGTASTQPDPVVSSIRSGFILDVRPHFIQGTGRIAVELRIDRSEHKLDEAAVAPPGTGPIQLPADSVLGRRSTVACKEGAVTIVGVETRGTGDAAEEVVLLLRARANALK